MPHATSDMSTSDNTEIVCCTIIVLFTVSFYLQGSNGSVVFTGLKKGRYILKIFAHNKLLDVAALKMVIVV